MAISHQVSSDLAPRAGSARELFEIAFPLILSSGSVSLMHVVDRVLSHLVLGGRPGRRAPGRDVALDDAGPAHRPGRLCEHIRGPVRRSEKAETSQPGPLARHFHRPLLRASGHQRGTHRRDAVSLDRPRG